MSKGNDNYDLDKLTTKTILNYPNNTYVEK